jgi:hypothetical protein
MASAMTSQPAWALADRLRISRRPRDTHLARPIWHAQTAPGAVAHHGNGDDANPFTASGPVIGAAIPFVALGGGTVMTMAYALIMPLMPADEHGRSHRLLQNLPRRGQRARPGHRRSADLGHSARIVLGHTGVSGDVVVCAAAAFASLFFLRRLDCAKDDQERREANASGG